MRGRLGEEGRGVVLAQSIACIGLNVKVQIFNIFPSCVFSAQKGFLWCHGEAGTCIPAMTAMPYLCCLVIARFVALP